MELTAKEVTPRDILRVIDMARLQTSSDQYEALHVVPLEYRVDELTGISNPIGKTGMKFGMWAQVITASSSVCTTLMNTLDQVKLEVQDITAHHVATARAVLTPDERDKGVLLLDVGGGTMDITVYGEGVVRHLSSVAVGGSHVTHDLAVGLRTPIAEAERIKRQYGRALQSLVDTEDMIDVQGVGGKEIQPTSRKLIGEIIECRVEEIFALALQRIQHYDLSRDLSAGAVITGGASVMPGMMQAAETILELPVRLGLPAQISGLTDLVNTPMYATAVGLALCGKDRLLEAEAHRSTHPGIAQAFQRIVAWVHNFF
jgi:cell division protein FtsA